MARTLWRVGSQPICGRSSDGTRRLRPRAKASSSIEPAQMSCTRHVPGIMLLALLGVSLTGQARAASVADWEGCSAIPADAERLACYDRVSGRSQPEVPPAPQPEARPAPVAEQQEEKLLSAL